MTIHRQLIGGAIFNLCLIGSALSQHLYLIQDGPDHRVVRTDLDGLNPVGIFPGEYMIQTALVVDPVAGFAYVADESSHLPRIARIDLSTGTIVSLVTGGLERPDSLALDVEHGLLFWYDGNTNLLERSNLDGSGRMTIASPGTATIGIDQQRQKIYWHDWQGNGEMQRANYDGSDVETLFSPAEIVHGIAIDSIGEKIYFSVDRDSDHQASISRVNLDGSGLEILVEGVTGQDRFMNVALDLQGQKVYWRHYFDGTIERANLDGTAHEVVATEIGVFSSSPVAGKLYWTGGNRLPLRRSNPDGTGLETLFTTVGPSVRRLQVDSFGGHIYWVEDTGSPYWSMIQRSKLDGSDTQTIRSGPIQHDWTGYRFIVGGLIFEPVFGLLYWFDNVNDTFHRMRPDGSNEELLVDISAWGGDGHYMGVDPFEYQIYWTYDNFPDETTTIRRAGLDGLSVTDVITGLPRDFKFLRGVALDPYNSTLNWIQWYYPTWNTSLYQSDLGGQFQLVGQLSPEPPLTSTWPSHCLVDPIRKSVYWTEQYQENTNSESFSREHLYRFDPTIGAPQRVLTGLREGTMPAAVTSDPTFGAEAAGPRKLQLTMPLARSEVVSLRVTLPDYLCLTYYVGADGGLTDQSFAQAPSQWGNVTIEGLQIVPDTRYVVEAIHVDGTVSAPLAVRTKTWGDLVAPFADGGTVQPDFTDVHTLVSCFRNVPGYPQEACDLHPAVPDGIVNFSDVSAVVDAFRGVRYPYEMPEPCP